LGEAILTNTLARNRIYCAALLLLGACQLPSPAEDEAVAAAQHHVSAAPLSGFLTGVNLGNIKLLPFAEAPYEQSPDQLRALLRRSFRDLHNAGANSIRFWLHIDGSLSPSFSSGRHGEVTGLPHGFIDDLKWLLRTAYLEYGLLTDVVLWSHDILAARRLNPVVNRDRTVRMVTDPGATRAYIDNALVPMLQALAAPMPGSDRTYLDAVLAWEVLNEPEGMSWYWRLYHNYQYKMVYGNYRWTRESRGLLDDRRRTEWARDTGGWGDDAVEYRGWHFIKDDGEFNKFLYKDVIDDYPSEWDYLKNAIVARRELATRSVDHVAIQAFINRVAGAIHRTAPGARVMVGAHSMPYTTDIAMPGLDEQNAPRNYYSDDQLIAAGGVSQGTVDLFQAHSYPLWGHPHKTALMEMFEHPAHHWRLDRPLIVGEHWSLIGTDERPLTVADYVYLHDQGYAGVWGWAYLFEKERWDAQRGAWVRWVDKHVNQDYFLELLRQMPSRIRYPAGP
jgi:hypothetical protein